MASTDVRVVISSKRASAALLATLVLASAALPLSAAEVYGKPLRGLTPVTVREAVTSPGRFAGQDIRVAGPNAGPEGQPGLKNDDLFLPIVSDGSFKLPGKLDGAKLTAEGRLKRERSSVLFVATGLEVGR